MRCTACTGHGHFTCSPASVVPSCVATCRPNCVRYPNSAWSTLYSDDEASRITMRPISTIAAVRMPRLAECYLKTYAYNVGKGTPMRFRVLTGTIWLIFGTAMLGTYATGKPILNM